MKEQKPQQGPPAAVWAWVGWVSLVATALFYLAVLLHLGKGDASGVLEVGGVLAFLFFTVALGRAIFLRRRDGWDPASTPFRSRWTTPMRAALAGLLCVGTGAAQLAAEHFYRVRQDERCLAEAQAAVEAYFQKNPHPTLGDFQKMTGEGSGYPSGTSKVITT
jgi:hypothetical protein